jgi:drug/metabolite transporter (DMT)-like permease
MGRISSSQENGPQSSAYDPRVEGEATPLLTIPPPDTPIPPAAPALPTTASVNKGIALVLLSAAAFGTMPIFAKLAYAEMAFSQSAEVKTVLAIRFCGAALFMWLLWAWQRRTGRAPRVEFKLSTILPLVALGALGYVGQSFSYFTAIGIISASATGLLLYTYPILVTLLAWLFFRESLTARKLLALGLATIGTLMVLGVAGALLGGNTPTLGTLDPAGATWAVAAAVIYSVYIIAGTRFTAGVPPFFASAVIITSAAAVYTLWGLSLGELHLDLPGMAWLWLSCIALICTVVAIAAFFAGLRFVGPSRAAIASTVEPAVTVLLAPLVLQETITPQQIVGGVLVLCSVLVLQWPSRQTAGPQVVESTNVRRQEKKRETRRPTTDN